MSIFCADHRMLSAWYRDTFGFQELSELTTPIFTALAAGPVALGFHHNDAYDLLGIPSEREPSGTRSHLVIDVGSADEVDRIGLHLLSLGVTLIREAFTTYYDARQVVLLDPEANVLRLSSTQDALRLVSRVAER